MSGHLAPLLDRLRALREITWDEAAGLERVPPGVAPGVDLAALGLHTVRESGLGALADLEDGRAERARRTLGAVLALQLDAPGRPWDGTFPITAEQPPPPEDGAVEWLHYDPNWRQFLGAVLGLTVARHEAALGPDLVARVVAGVERCARGEPVDRIAPWYTNPDLLHAWVLAWVGARVGDAELVGAGEARAEAAQARVAAAGDVDEYSSPTYDGVDLVALGLWVTHPPTPAFTAYGTAMLAVVGPRLAALFHPGLGAMCGPYIRAYGLGLDRYVALVAPWLVAAGAPVTAVLPWPLDETTDHVHDLWFAPVVAALAPAVDSHLVLRTDLPRRHVQRFDAIEAVSILTPDAALGAERGRRPEFARDQHVPLTVHTAAGWVGVAPGDGVAGIDAEIVDDVGVRARIVPAEGAATVAVRTLWSEQPAVDGGTVSIGGIELASEPAPDVVEVHEEHRGTWAVLTWAAGTAPALVASWGRRDGSDPTSRQE